MIHFPKVKQVHFGRPNRSGNGISAVIAIYGAGHFWRKNIIDNFPNGFALDSRSIETKARVAEA